MPNLRGRAGNLSAPRRCCQPLQRHDKYSCAISEIQATGHGYNAVGDGAGKERRRGRFHAANVQHPLV